MRVAGAFAPTEGYLRLQGRDSKLQLQSEGRCVGRAVCPAWRVEAARVRWIGEFIEAANESKS
jgi:hypothetical protein